MNSRELCPQLIDYFTVVGAEDGVIPLPKSSTQPRSLHLQQKYKPQLLHFYPAEFGETELRNEFPLFCFPDGLRLFTEATEPRYFHFVLTDQLGRRLRCASIIYSCLIKNSSSAFSGLQSAQRHDSVCCVAESDSPEFSRRIRRTRSISYGPTQSLVRSSSGIPSLQSRKRVISLKRSSSTSVVDNVQYNRGSKNITGWYSLRSICVISCRPIYSFMSTCLKQIYEYVQQNNADALKDFVKQLVANVQLPPSYKYPIQWTIEFREGSCLTKQFEVELPSYKDLPLIQFPIRHLLHSLNLDDVIDVLFAVALEHRVLLTSRSDMLITYAMESIAVLLHPFRYHHTYIPLLPRELISCIEAPTPYLMGVNINYLIKRSSVDMTGVVHADLDNGRLVIPESEALPHLPEDLIKTLKHCLQPHIHPEINELHKLEESAVDWERHELEIRMSFANFFYNLYSTYFSQTGLRLADQPRSIRAFLRNFMDTQSFKQLKNYLSLTHVSAEHLYTELNICVKQHRQKRLRVISKLSETNNQLVVQEVTENDSINFLLSARRLSEAGEHLESLVMIKQAWTSDCGCICSEQTQALLHNSLSKLSAEDLSVAKKIVEDSSVLSEAVLVYSKEDEGDELMENHKQMLQQVKTWPEVPLSLQQLLKMLSTCLGCSRAQCNTLFELLQRGCARRKTLKQKTVKSFLERLYCIQQRSHSHVPENEVIFYSTSVWLIDDTKGRLYISNMRIALQADDCVRYYFISQIDSLMTYNHRTGFPPGYPCIKLRICGAIKDTLFLFESEKHRDICFMYIQTLRQREWQAVLLTEAVRLLDDRFVSCFCLRVCNFDVRRLHNSRWYSV